jgi:hypothetical protein
LPLQGSQIPGLLIYLLITAGWFSLSYCQFGPPLVTKMLGRELIGSVALEAKYHFPGSQFYRPPLYYLGRCAPWSIFAYLGLWRVWRSPEAEPNKRRFERFLFCWFLSGLLVFCFSPHQRSDLLWPLVPAGALLAGRELDVISQRMGRKVFDPLMALVSVILVAGFFFYYFSLLARNDLIRQTIALKNMADEIGHSAGPEPPLTFVDASMGLQVFLNTWHPAVSFERAAGILRGPVPAFVAVRDIAKLEAARQEGDPAFYTILPVSAGSTYAGVRIVSNRPSLEHPHHFAFLSGTLRIEAENARLEDAGETTFTFADLPGPSEISFTNESSKPRHVRLRITNRPFAPQEHALAPGEIWRTVIP